MKYYKGNFGSLIDEPIGGGSYVRNNKDGHEKCNFDPADMTFDDDRFPAGRYCLGFVETKSLGEKSNQLHIEKIEGCELYNKEEAVEDVLVIYCATHPAHRFTTIVGWYKHATVYRDYHKAVFSSGDDEEVQWYNAIAKEYDCVLLPVSERSRKTVWSVPRKQSGAAYGFGRANVWFAHNTEGNRLLVEFLNKISKQIDEYEGENWINKYPE
jgi:hypothetical protein